MLFATKSRTTPGRLGQGISAKPEKLTDPLRVVERRKLRWLVATSLTGLAGIAILSGALLLISEPVEQKIATKRVLLSYANPAARLDNGNLVRQLKRGEITDRLETESKLEPKTNNERLEDEYKISRKATRNSSLVAKNNPRLRPAPKNNREVVASLSTLAPTTKALKTPATGTPIEPALRADTGQQNATLKPITQPQLHGDLLSAVKDRKKDTKLTAPASKPIKVLPQPAKPETGSDEIRLIVRKGDTLFGLLSENGVNANDAQGIIRELKPVFSPRNLKKGQILALKLHRDQKTGVTRPSTIELKTKSARKIAVKLGKNGSYERIGKPVELARLPQTRSNVKRKRSGNYQRARARIKSSFYKTAQSQNLPPRIINKMTRILSYDIDFQREVNRGDTFEVLYSDSGKNKKGVLYAELVTNRKKHAFYRFKTPDGIVSYYNQKGASAQKTFMRTPISGARITSRFGRRRHPILGYTKMHTGVDFGVARGTPIYAAASGKIQKAGWAGGYGKYVRISHSKKLATAYAHMSRIAKGIRPGRRVSQGQIIGYVGSTGRSTGPHLHYEIRVNNKPVNPMRYKLANKTQKLSRKWLALFKKEKSRIDRLRKSTPVTTYVATAQN